MFDGNGVASVAGIGNALRYGGRYGDIVNNSWGGGAPSNLISDAINWGITNGRGGLGATYFFSAGNGGVGSLSYPASLTLSIPGLISVGSTNNRGQRSDYSQYGVGLDIVAPSDDWRNNTYQAIVTTDRTGTNNGYAANSRLYRNLDDPVLWRNGIRGNLFCLTARIRDCSLDTFPSGKSQCSVIADSVEELFSNDN
jgi:hypothetical protein